MLVNVSIAVLLTALAVVALETAVRTRWVDRWADRGFSTATLTSRGQISERALIPLAASIITVVLCGSPAAALAAATAAWLCALAITTDLIDVKIPKEPTWVVLAIGIAAAISTRSWTVIAFAIVTFVLLAVLLGLTALVSRGGLGSGDVRLMLALTPLAGWLGVTTFLWGLLAACLLQLPLRYLVYKRRYPDRSGYPFAPALVGGLIIAAIITISTGVATAEMADFQL